MPYKVLLHSNKSEVRFCVKKFQKVSSIPYGQLCRTIISVKVDRWKIFVKKIRYFSKKKENINLSFTAFTGFTRFRSGIWLIQIMNILTNTIIYNFRNWISCFLTSNEDSFFTNIIWIPFTSIIFSFKSIGNFNLTKQNTMIVI